MEKFFSVFGKVVLVILVLGIFTYGGYYYGMKTFNSKIVDTEINQNVLEDNQEVEYQEETVKEIQEPTLVLKTIIGGLSKEAGLSFSEYSIQIPEDWQTKKESQTAMDQKLTIFKGDHSIAIFQAATGGALCLYPGDGEFEGPSSKFSNFVNLTTKDNINLRRSGDVNGTAFTICQKSLDGSYQQPTNYGHISIKLGATENKEALTEVDLMISSLKKI